MRRSSWRHVIEWSLAAPAAAMCLLGVGLIVREQAATMTAPGDTWWPLPGLILLEIVLAGLAGGAGVAVERGPAGARWHTATWAAAGALAAIGAVGWFGFSVIVFALAPALLFGLAAAVADWRRRRLVEVLGPLALSAALTAVVVVGLIGLSRR